MNSSLLRIFSVFLFSIYFAFGFGLSGQKLPSQPTQPKSPDLDLDSRGEKKSEKDTGTDANSKKRDIMIILCDGRKIQGKWEEKKTELTFFHLKDGIRYKKVIESKNLGSVKILSWTPGFNKQEKDGASYKYTPSKVELKTKKDEVFEKDQGLDGTDFLVLNLENQNGIATIYGLWMDLLFKDGSWYSKLPKLEPEKERTECHKDVWREIVFLGD